MAILRLEAFVLRTYALGDTSRIAVLYTREMGLVRAVAKGARVPKSKFAGALEPLSRVEALLYWKEGRELQLLSSAELLEPWAGGVTDLDRLAHAQAASEFVDRLVWGEEVHEPFYLLLRDTLRSTAQAPPESLPAVTLAFQMQAAALLGYRPVLDRCAACSLALTGQPAFAAERGGLVCEPCASREPGAIRLSAGAVETMRRLLEADLAGEPPSPAARSGELLRVMENFLQTHFQRFAGFRSLELLRELHQAPEAPPSGTARSTGVAS